MVDNELLEYMLSYLSENRLSNFNKVVNFRTRHLTVVLEDIYHPQNASAVIRTCDIYGVQDLNIIENRNTFEVNPKVVIGSSKWIDLHKYSEAKNNTVESLKELKKQGYRIVATSPHANGYTIHDLPLDDKIALCFGTEETGLSKEALELADDHVVIPMFGFTESFNISVSAAICLSHITKRLHESEIDWELSDEEKKALLLEWAVKSVQRGEEIRDDFLKKRIQQ